jgi:predicted nucleic acid-binding protein
MSGFLVDTNVVSEFRKKERCNPNVKAWSDAQPRNEVFISVVVLAEIRFGILSTSDVAFKKDLEDWLQNEVRTWFSGRALRVDERVILRWREMLEKGRKSGHTFSQPDLFIAAQADLRDLTVVTRNVDDFKVAGVPVLNPWEYTGKVT